MKKPKDAKRLPIPVTRALQNLGRGLSEARRRRRIPAALLAQRASINRMTLHKIEKGEPGVAMGSYATVLFALGLLQGLPDLSDAKNDPVGLALEEENLPKRIHLSRRKNASSPDGESRA